MPPPIKKKAAAATAASGQDLHSLKVERVDPKSLKSHPRNVRRHPEENIQAIMRSLTEFGQQKPLVVDIHNQVIAGNGTLESIMRLGWKRCDIVRTQLDGAKAEAFAIMDNKATDMSEFDFQALASVMRTIEADGVSLDLTGFQSYETEPLLQAEWKPQATATMPEEGPSKSGRHYHLYLETEQWEIVQQAIEWAQQNLTDYSVEETGDALTTFCHFCMQKIKEGK